MVNNQLELAKQFETWGANPAQKLKKGNTLFHAAVLQNCAVQTLQYILEKKVDITAQNDSLDTPLHLLCLNPDEERFGFFLRNRANFNLRNSLNQTPLDTLAGTSSLYFFCEAEKRTDKSLRQDLAHFASMNSRTEIF